MSRPRKEQLDRPATEDVEVKVPDGSGGIDVRLGASLDSIVRAVLWDVKNEARWSLQEAADHLGVPLATFQTFMSGGGMRLATLSRICAAMKLTPDRLFQSHERYAPENRETIRFVEDAVYERFRGVLTPDQARTALEVLEHAKSEGNLDERLKAFRTLSGVPEEKPKRRKREKAASR